MSIFDEAIAVLESRKADLIDDMEDEPDHDPDLNDRIANLRRAIEVLREADTLELHTEARAK